MASGRLYGHVAAAAGLLLLAGLIAVVPQRSGVPEHRVVEAGLFWLGQSLVLLGSRRYPLLASGRAPGEAAASPARVIAASLGIVMALGMCVLAISNLLSTTLWGVRLVETWLPTGLLYPEWCGYVLAVPALLGGVLQLPLMGTSLHPEPAIPPWPLRVVRVIGLVLLLLLFVACAGACLLSLVDRRLAAAAVAVTWLASLGFTLLAAGQLLQVVASRAPPPARPPGGA